MDTPRLRAFGYCAIAGTSRAVATAFAMAHACQGPASGDSRSILDGRLRAFVATWTAFTLLPALALSAAELPLILALPGATQAARERRAIATAIALGAGAAWLGAALLPWLAPLRYWSALALATGAVGGWLCPPIGRSRGPAIALAWAALLAIFVAVVLWAAPFAPAPHAIPGQDPAPVAVAESNPNRAHALVRAWIARHPLDAERTPPDAGTALAIEGLLVASRAYGDEVATQYARAWLAREVDRAILAGINGDGAAVTAAWLALLGDDPLDPRGRDALTAIRTRTPRTRVGPPSAWGGLAPRGNTLESLSAYGLVLARAARLDRDPELHLEARALWDAMQRSLGNDRTHLFRHAWIELGFLDARLPVEAVFWARGQALTLRFLAEHLYAERALARTPDTELARELVRYALVLIGCQDPSGLWTADLESGSDAPFDVSASALLAATLSWARTTGTLEPREVRGLDEAIARAAVGLRRAILWEGGIPRVAGGMRDPPIGYGPLYRTVTAVDDEPHAIGAVLLWLASERPAGLRKTPR